MIGYRLSTEISFAAYVNHIFYAFFKAEYAVQFSLKDSVV